MPPPPPQADRAISETNAAGRALLGVCDLCRKLDGGHFDTTVPRYALVMTTTWEYDIISVTYGPGAGRTLEDAKSELNRRGAAGWEIVGNITTGYDADTGDLPHNIQPVLYLLAKRPTSR